MVNDNGRTMIVWQGVSEIDHVSPVVVLAAFKSANVKTGNMVQIVIVVDGVKPTDAIKSDADVAVCGNCIHKGDKAAGKPRTCYVPMRFVNSVYGAYERGNARALDLSQFAGRSVRFGAYGDPAAVPFEVWEKISTACNGDITGYTHQWQTCDPRFSRVCMASADSFAEYGIARRAGWRAFVPRELGAPKPKGLVQCPATAGKANTVTCISCMQCGGTDNGRKASISIEVHGSTARHFKSLPLSVA
jgi:hypothetical protein